MSSPITGTGAREKRNVKPNSHYPPQPAVIMTNDRRQNQSPKSAPRPSGARRQSGASASPGGGGGAKSGSGGAGDGGANNGGGGANSAGGRSEDHYAQLLQRVVNLEQQLTEYATVGEKLQALEEEVRDLKESEGKAREEVRALRDRVEEMEWGIKNCEKMHKEAKEETGKVSMEVKSVRDDWEKWEEEKMAQWKEEVKDLVRQVAGEVNGGRNHGGGERQEGLQREAGRIIGGAERSRRKRCVVVTDSNGKEATADTINNHIPREERGDYDISVVVAHTLDTATRRVLSGEIDVSGAIVIVDNLTNDVRGSWQQKACTPEELLWKLNGLKEAMSNADAIIVCEVKPMRNVYVMPHNQLLHDYVLNQPFLYGCRTQIRMEFLDSKGFHILPEYGSVLDRTYACALRAIDVPCPTPFENFVPEFMRRQFEREWPRLVGNRSEGHVDNHGWKW